MTVPKDPVVPKVPLKPVTDLRLVLMAEEIGMMGELYLDESDPSNMTFIKLACMRCDRGEWKWKINIVEKPTLIFARDVPLEPGTKVLTTNMRPAEIVESKKTKYIIKILNRSGPKEPDRRHLEAKRRSVYSQRVTEGLFVCDECFKELEPMVAERGAKIVKVGKR